MDIYLYKNTLDKRYLYKSPGLTQLTSTPLSALLKDDTSVTDPVFEVTYSDSYWNANYIYSSDMKRYYYVNNIEFSQNRMYFHCHVDVLMSFQEAIKEKVILVKRSSNHKNYYLEDDKLQSYAMPCKRVLLCESVGGVGRVFSGKTERSYVLGIVGKNPDAPSNGGE